MRDEGPDGDRGPGTGDQKGGSGPRSPVPGPSPVPRAWLLVVLAACGFGSISVLASVAMADGAPLPTALALRYLLAAPLLLVAAGGVAAARTGGRRTAELLLLGGGGQAVLALVSLSALHYISAATLAFLFYTYPAWIAVIAAVRGTERPTPRRLAALALSLGGIATIVGNPLAGALHPTGVLLALGAALFYAGYVPLLGWLQRGISPAAASMYVAAGAAVGCLAWGAAAGGLTLEFGVRGWLAVGGLAVLSTVLAFILFLRGLAALGPVRTGIVSTVEPFWTAVLAAAVLRQPLSARTLVGGAMIAAAVALLQLRGGGE